MRCIATSTTTTLESLESLRLVIMIQIARRKRLIRNHVTVKGV